jgi:hypothetical protein
MSRAVKSTVFIGLLLASASAYAQATRTWVSGVGDDVNPCSRTAPCKTFAGAISKTAAGGEIDVLDPGGYGTVTITKSITIDGQGTMASILASGTNGINVNAGVSDNVILRNLSINGAGTTLGLNGINFLAGANLTVENCIIMDFSQSGISIAPSTANAMTYIRNVSIDNTATGVTISTANSAGQNIVAISESHFHGAGVLNQTGVAVNRPAGKPGNIVTITKSDFADYLTGVSNIGGNSVTVDQSLLIRNVTGVDTQAGATSNLNLNTFVNNPTAFTTAGSVSSAGNNTIVGAVSSPNGTALPLK